jgi:hypothetical protein
LNKGSAKPFFCYKILYLSIKKSLRNNDLATQPRQGLIFIFETLKLLTSYLFSFAHLIKFSEDIH